MALADFLDDDLCIMDKVSRPDGFGGFVWQWLEGVHFLGKALRKSGDQITIAMQQGMNAVYTITTQATVVLERGDYVKRIRDGAILKVTTDPIDGTPPAVSSIKCLMVQAERTTL